MKNLIRPVRKTRDRLLRQDDILQAAEHVFATKGYYQATIADIAAEAQYAVGTIYLYFKDKENLYLTLIEKKIQGLISTVRKKVKLAKNPSKKIEVLITTHLGYFQENANFFRIFFSEKNASWTIKDRFSKTTVNRFITYIGYLASLMKEAQQEGFIRKELNPGKIAYILVAMLNAVTFFPWISARAIAKETPERKVNFILEVFWQGVGTK